MAAGGGYRVELSNPAAKQLRKLPRPIQERIAPRLASLANETRPPGSEKLAGHEDRYRIRIGDYRAIYEIADDRLIVLVLTVRHRRDVYRGDD